VTNLTNGRAVTVTITDRGPFAKNRVLDLSYAAAREVGMVVPGTAPVQLEIIE
jgi:rare lipoprotein A